MVTEIFLQVNDCPFSVQEFGFCSCGNVTQIPGNVTQIPMKKFLLIPLYFINYQNNENTVQHNYFYYKNKSS